MVPFRLTCLGPPELHGPDGDPIRFRTRKHLALMIYLALEPSIPHRRDRLATLLWPHTDLTESRHSLATALSMLRSYIGSDAFDARRDTLRLLPGRVEADTAALDGNDDEIMDLEIPGPFLEEFEIVDTPDFDLWRDVRHTELTPKIHRVLGRQIDFHRRRGDARRVEALGHRLQRIDDVAEEGTRALIEARAMSGDRIGAIRAFDHWGHRLHDEMGAEPSLFVEKMADRLRRRGWERPATVRTAPAPPDQWPQRHFVGRGTEFRVCYEAIEAVRQGAPRHVLIRGESGVGKTTLVERFASATALEGAGVARVQCYELERELPFATVVGVVNLLIDLPGASATAPDQLAELAVLVPRVRQKYPHLPAPQQSHAGEGARLLFTEAIMALIAAVADEQPLIVIVDDIHLADATSLAVLHLILRRVERMALMMILTSSSTLENEAPSARRFVDNAESIALTLVDLAPLPDEEATEILDLLLQSPTHPGPTLRRAILRTAQGNPMALTLLVGDWQRRGDDCLALSVGAMTATARAPAKETLRRAIESALTALDPEARATLELAAILGQRLNDLPLYALIDLPVSRTMLAMARLTSHRILRDAGTHLEFASEMIRSQCYHAMAAPLRRMLHGLIADHLLARATADEPIPGLEVAWHLVRADRLREAIPYLLAGGREAIRRGAPHEADLALTTGLPALKGAPRRTAILLLAEARQELGRWLESVELLDAAEDPFDESEECSRVVMQIIARRWLGFLAPVILDESTEALLEIAMREVDIEVRVKALAAMPYLLTQSRDASRLEPFSKVIEHVTTLPMDDYQKLHVLLATAWRDNQLGNVESAYAILAEALVLVEATETGSSVAIRLFIGAGTMYLTSGQYALAIPHFERAATMAKKNDNGMHFSTAASSLATVYGRMGNHQHQQAWADKALKHVRANDWGIVALSATYEKALSLIFLEKYEEAQTTILQLGSRVDPRKCPPWVTQVSRLMTADIWALAGRDGRAISAARRATTGINATLHLSDFLGPFARWKAIIAVKDSSIEACLEHFNQYRDRLEKYHRKDQVELLASIAFLRDNQDFSGDSDLRIEVHQRLTSLPETITVVLRRLGLLPSLGKQTRRGRKP